MTRRGKFERAIGIALSAAIWAAITCAPRPVAAQNYTLSPDLAAKVAGHPHVRRLTQWGGRFEWSTDSRKLLFVSREFGDVFELELANGEITPLTFSFPHHGFLRAYYLPYGGLLLTGTPDAPFDIDGRKFSRWFEPELWILRAGDAAPKRLGVRNFEGVAVSRNSMQIVWTEPQGDKPVRRPDSRFSEMWSRELRPSLQMWTATIGEAGRTPKLVNRRKLLDCSDPTGDLKAILDARRQLCVIIEPQNFVPGDDAKVTFVMMSLPTGASRSEAFGAAEYGAYVLDTNSGRITRLAEPGVGYVEPEGIFPDGRYTLVEHAAGESGMGATSKIDLWRLKLDGSGRLDRVTHFHKLDPRLKANQGVVSPDGRWMAFGVSTDELEQQVAGGSLGIYLMDMQAAGFGPQTEGNR